MILLPVGSFDVTARVDSLQDDGLPGDLYVEIKQDGVAVRTTKVVKRNKQMCWNQEFLMYVRSHSLSTH
jgi:Ca2+-dependent lipid-binding protein